MEWLRTSLTNMKATNAALRAELELEAKTHSLDVAKSNLLKEPFLWQLLHYGKQYAPKVGAFSFMFLLIIYDCNKYS